jgi:uncharacterized protein YggE
MKNLILLITLSSSLMVFGQNETTNTKSVSITTTVSKEYKPDFYIVSLSFKEYEQVNPENQKVTRYNLSEVEKNIMQKLKELNIKESTIENVGISESVNLQNNYIYNQNYNSTQKRDLNKIIKFKVNSMDELEKMFNTMRINGVSNIYATPKFSQEKELEIEIELQKMAITNAKLKAKEMEALIDNQLGEIIRVEKGMNPSYSAPIYNYNNYNILNLGDTTKYICLKITFEIETAKK